MKKSLLKYNFFFLFIAISFVSHSQNLVFNGSFEIRDSIFQNSDQKYYDCPYLSEDGDHNYNPQLKMAKGWQNPSGKLSYYFDYVLYEIVSSSDYFHSCGHNPNNIPSWVNKSSVLIPRSIWLSMYQFPRTGEGYAASIMYGFNVTFRINTGEYIQSGLVRKLDADTMYKVVFYLSNSNGCSYSLQTQGAVFSSENYSIENLLLGIESDSIVPQIENQNGFITDTLSWTKIEGVFKAKGDEKFITIGNFDLRKVELRNMNITPIMLPPLMQLMTLLFIL